MRRIGLTLIGICLLLAALGPWLAYGAGPLGGTRPWWIERVAVASTSDWDVYTAPTWARQAIVRNAHATAPLYLGNYDETGAFVSATDDYFTIPAGGAVVLPLSAGVAQSPDTSHLTIPLASASASHPVEIVLLETPE